MKSESQSPSRSHNTSHLPDFPSSEEEVLAFWDSKNIFAKTLQKTESGKPFVFYEGPPTANGRPGIHHVLARAFKDVIVRFQTMRGRYVSRRAGWDTHGLPVELQVEKELKISGKKDIENIVAGDKRASIAEFNARCKADVMSLIQDWEKMTRRIGYWLDFEHAYRTYTNDYIETLWWIIKEMSTHMTLQGPLLYKGYKVVPHCPRCETALSSHEVAQGYKTVQDTSVYVKFKITKTNLLKAQSYLESGEPVYILSWTTTPWTLPGNVALAIKKDMTYVIVKQGKEHFILAKERLGDVIGTDVETELEFRGKDLLETQYEPVFNTGIDAKGYPNAWTVLDAKFVTAEDGTGVVHTAVMYGEDDYQLGLAKKLPTQHTVDQSGHFLPSVKELAGLFVKDEQTEKIILEKLSVAGNIFKVEPITHEYPFCWRCSTPLLYYAKDSWYVRMSALRNELQKNNKKIKWIPDHIKEGRFGEWLRETKDWAFSRERYWGTPLPIWECKTCGNTEVIGSFEELRKRAIHTTLPKKKRRVFIVRHGESTSNIEEVFSNIVEHDRHHLTTLGKNQAREAGESLKGKIDLIVTSDFIRTKETSEIISKITGASIVVDARLRETSNPDYDGKSLKEFKKLFPSERLRLFSKVGGRETIYSLGKRVEEAVVEAAQRFSNKRLLFVSHGDPIASFLWFHEGGDEKHFEKLKEVKRGVIHEVTLKEVPLNPHRPYIDDIELRCTCKKRSVMHRVEEVADVWFDSGSMPFAQAHYPFEHTAEIENGTKYPADYISEAIDQTRGWFYTMLAVSTVLGKGSSYKNVICLGHILDDKGEKMSKSKGNIVDPWKVINETGADALRFLFYSMNQPGDAKLFSRDAVREVVKKVFMILWNVQSFYLLYAKPGIIDAVPASSHVLDRWLLARLEQTRKLVTDNLDSFHVFEGSRALKDFIQDLSTWYVRRSRDRMKEGNPEVQQTLGYALNVTLGLCAPFAPLLSESMYLRLKGKTTKAPESIHLTDWPKKITETEPELLEQMAKARIVVELLLSVRKEKNIKSRQPLALAETNVEIHPDIASIVAEEVNVDVVRFSSSISKELVVQERNGVKVGLQITMTPELELRGKQRELLRHVNDLRRLARLAPADTAVLYITASPAIQKLISDYVKELKESAGIVEVVFDMPDTVEVKKVARIAGEQLTLGLIIR
jgi:isoleucyl-tRNA synthetase